MGRRLDGYHLLESFFWPLDFSDDIFIKTSAGEFQTKWGADSLFPESPLPNAAENICATAYRWVEERVGKGELSSVSLEKRIPIGGGLGGGSSNAGTLLRELSRRYQLDSTAVEAFAVTLGADVSYFLSPVPAWVTGIGEKREPVEVSATLQSQLRFLLVFPPFSTSTNEIFAEFKKTHHEVAKREKAPVPKLENLNSLSQLLRTARNDLLPCVQARHPLIPHIINALRDSGSLFATLSGSGSTCFGIFENDSSCNQALKDLQQFFRKNDCKSLMTRTFQD